VADGSPVRWRLPGGQRLLFEEFDDGIVVFDALVGSTHLVNVTAAEALELLGAGDGLTAAQLHAALLERLGLAASALPRAAVDELLARLAQLDLAAPG
jgi:PqqD family protein of HPr-rel-A system